MPWLIYERYGATERKGRLSHHRQKKREDEMKGRKREKELLVIPLHSLCAGVVQCVHNGRITVSQQSSSVYLCLLHVHFYDFMVVRYRRQKETEHIEIERWESQAKCS